MSLLRDLWNRYRRAGKASRDVPTELWNARGSAASGVRGPAAADFGDPTQVNDKGIPESHVAHVRPRDESRA